MILQLPGSQLATLLARHTDERNFAERFRPPRLDLSSVSVDKARSPKHSGKLCECSSPKPRQKDPRSYEHTRSDL